MRGGTYKGPHATPDPSGGFLHGEGLLVGDNVVPILPVMYVYHNTLLRETPVFRDYFLFGLGAQGLRNNERDVFNNIFVQTHAIPGVGFAGIKEPGNLREGGNLLWGLEAGPNAGEDFFAKFRATPLFTKSREYYDAGFTSNDRVADPKFVALSTDRIQAADLRLSKDSPAVNAGLPVPEAWPDPLREADQGRPDIGALPLGAEAWRIGIDGRLSVFGN
jgi:hypothetical protein